MGKHEGEDRGGGGSSVCVEVGGKLKGAVYVWRRSRRVGGGRGGI